MDQEFYHFDTWQEVEEVIDDKVEKLDLFTITIEFDYRDNNLSTYKVIFTNG